MMTSSSIKRVSIKRQLQQFSVQDKLDAIQRVNEGESKASVARDIGVPESTLRGWCKSEDKLRCSSTELENEGGIIGDGGGLAGLCNGTLDVVGSSAKRARSDNPAVSAATSCTKDPELDEALWYWLRQQQQHVAGLSEQLCQAAAATAVQQQQHHLQQQQQAAAAAAAVKSQQQQSSAAAVAAAAAAAVAATTGAMVSNSAVDLNPSTGWFWRWYKRYGLTTPDALGKMKPTDSALPLLTTTNRSLSSSSSLIISPTTNNNNNTLLNRTPAPAHTPQPAHTHSHSSTQNPAPAHIPVHALAPAHQQTLPVHSVAQPTNLHVSSSTASTTAASSMVVVASNSSGVPAAAMAAPPEPDDPSDDEDDEPPLSAAEAVAHGEKFLRWLDCCSDPSVTALQILQFRYLLNNVRACAARRAKAAANRDKS